MEDAYEPVSDDAAVMRGQCGVSEAVMHRSPRVCGTGIVRLLLHLVHIPNMADCCSTWSMGLETTLLPTSLPSTGS